VVLRNARGGDRKATIGRDRAVRMGFKSPFGGGMVDRNWSDGA